MSTSTKPSERQIVGVVPGGEYVADRPNANGGHEVLPVVAFAVWSDGEVQAVPFSLGPEWVIRPRLAEDDRFVQASALSLFHRTPWLSAPPNPDGTVPHV